MNKSTPIRTGLLGFGLSGRVFHAPFLEADEHFTLAVIVTANSERQAQARRLHSQALILESSDELFERAGELDLVVIGTPPQTHHALARQAIEAGLSVVVDKPFATDVAEGEELITLAAEKGVLLTVFQNRRWDADYLTLKRLLDDGAFGDVFRFESRFESYKPGGGRAWKGAATVAQGGGILFDLGTHLLDQALQLFGPVESAYAELATRHPQAAADDDAFVALRHASGVTSHLWMNSFAAQKGARFHVLGRSAGYTKWGLDGQESALRSGALPSDAAFGVEPPSSWGVLGVEGELSTVEPDRGDYAGFYRQLAAALTEGAPVPVDPRDALQVLELIGALRA